MASESQLLEHRDSIEKWLTASKPLALTKVPALLHRDHGVDISYAAVRAGLSTHESGQGRQRDELSTEIR